METTLLGRPTFGGLASGFDTNALLEGLLAIERQPLQTLQTRRSEIDTQRGLMRSLNTKLMALRDAARALDNRNSSGTDDAVEEEFLRYEGSSEAEDVLTVRASRGAAPGRLDVVVQQVARGSRRFSDVYADPNQTIALAQGQQITISLPNADPDAVPPVEATEITIAPDSDLTLQELRDRINTDVNNGGAIRADVLQIDDDQFRLVLTSTGTGAENEITVGGDFAMTDLGRASNNAQSAVIELFGETVTRSTNTISDALPGIVFELKDVSPVETDPLTGDPITVPDPNDPFGDPIPVRQSVSVSVDVDVEAVADGLDTFVKAYNDVMAFIDGQLRYDESKKSAGPLSGDFTLRDIQTQLRSLVSKGFKFTANESNPFAYSVGESEGGTIGGIGLVLSNDGRLRVDKEKLSDALARDPLSVREFLRGAALDPNVDDPENQAIIEANPNDPPEPDWFQDGFATLVASTLEGIVRSADGTLARRDEAYQKRLDSFDDSIDRFEQRLAKREESLILRFSELERIVSSLQTQQGFLSGLG